MIELFLSNILLVAIIVVALYIWFDTDAVVEWGELLRLKFLRYKEYNDARKSALSSLAAKGYTTFLLFTYGNPKDSSWWSFFKAFWIRLITCPVCWTVWLNAIALLIVSGSFLWLGINVIMSWLGYHGIRLLLKNWNV